MVNIARGLGGALGAIQEGFTNIHAAEDKRLDRLSKERERQLDRQHTTLEREAAQTWQAGQSALTREHDIKKTELASTLRIKEMAEKYKLTIDQAYIMDDITQGQIRLRNRLEQARDENKAFLNLDNWKKQAEISDKYNKENTKLANDFTEARDSLAHANKLVIKEIEQSYSLEKLAKGQEYWERQSEITLGNEKALRKYASQMAETVQIAKEKRIAAQADLDRADAARIAEKLNESDLKARYGYTIKELKERAKYAEDVEKRANTEWQRRLGLEADTVNTSFERQKTFVDALTRKFAEFEKELGKSAALQEAAREAAKWMAEGARATHQSMLDHINALASNDNPDFHEIKRLQKKANEFATTYVVPVEKIFLQASGVDMTALPGNKKGPDTSPFGRSTTRVVSTMLNAFLQTKTGGMLLDETSGDMGGVIDPKLSVEGARVAVINNLIRSYAADQAEINAINQGPESREDWLRREFPEVFQDSQGAYSETAIDNYIRKEIGERSIKRLSEQQQVGETSSVIPPDQTVPRPTADLSELDMEEILVKVDDGDLTILDVQKEDQRILGLLREINESKQTASGSGLAALESQEQELAQRRTELGVFLKDLERQKSERTDKRDTTKAQHPPQASVDDDGFFISTARASDQPPPEYSFSDASMTGQLEDMGGIPVGFLEERTVPTDQTIDIIEPTKDFDKEPVSVVTGEPPERVKDSRLYKINNPTGIKITNDQWEGSDTSRDAEFVTFTEPEFSYRAAARVMSKYRDGTSENTSGQKVNDVGGIIHLWLGGQITSDGERVINSTEESLESIDKYLRNIREITGGELTNGSLIENEDDLAQLLYAISVVEMGGNNPYGENTMEYIVDGIDLSGNWDEEVVVEEVSPLGFLETGPEPQFMEGAPSMNLQPGPQGSRMDNYNKRYQQGLIGQ